MAVAGVSPATGAVTPPIAAMLILTSGAAAYEVQPRPNGFL